jgi:tRNA(Ile)-lysidine synthase
VGATTETMAERQATSKKKRGAAVGFARRLLTEWRRRGWALGGERVLVAVSGGADSTALLLALEELTRTGRLGLGLAVAHLNHGLRGPAGEADARWVGELSAALGYECFIGEACVGERARATRDNLEQAARRARYEFLGRIALKSEARAVLTAHTLDDQAETVLLRLLRGSGAEGLSGMRAERELEQGGALLLRRPLLFWARRACTEAYCRERGVEPRLDAQNEDERFGRVRIRRSLLPLLSELNPRATEALARTAALLREDADALGALAAKLLAEARVESESAAESALGVEALAAAPPALRRRALRLWLEQERGDLRRIEAAHLLAVERLVFGERGGRVAELPGGWWVERRRGRLWMRSKKKD